MSKISRWRSGLKRAARPERDMTDASFNESYIISHGDGAIDKTEGNWKVGHRKDSKITDNIDPLTAERYEREGWKTRADISESVDTDEVEIVDQGKGMVYSEGKNKHRLIRSHITDKGTTILGNPFAGLNVHTETSPKWIKPLQPFDWVPPLGLGNVTRTLRDYSVTVPISPRLVGYFAGFSFSFNTPDVPFRMSVTNLDGSLMFESQSEYSWDQGEIVNRTAKGQVKLTSTEAFYLVPPQTFIARWQFAEDVEVLGDLRPGTQDPFYPLAGYYYAEAEEREMLSGATGEDGSIGASEFAVADIHDEKYAHSLHLKDLQILTMNDDEPILFTSRWDGQDEGQSEWALVHLIDPIPETLHLRSEEILTGDDGIPIIFTN